jgi:hypothetical protein
MNSGTKSLDYPRCWWHDRLTITSSHGSRETRPSFLMCDQCLVQPDMSPLFLIIMTSVLGYMPTWFGKCIPLLQWSEVETAACITMTEIRVESTEPWTGSSTPLLIDKIVSPNSALFNYAPPLFHTLVIAFKAIRCLFELHLPWSWQ